MRARRRVVVNAADVMRCHGSNRRRRRKDQTLPFEVGNQVSDSNHRKMLWPKAAVVNVAEKSEQDFDRYD